MERRTSLPQPYNRPGMSQLNYRLGRYGDFLRRMKARMATQETPEGQRPLAELTAYSPSDPALALLDAWATVADVLTFYQERIANEGFLRTATERRSLLELTRAIGYELHPGAAASTYLAFTVEDTPGAPAEVTVPRGTQVQSVPAEGKLPQIFETSEDLVARPEWNVLKPQLTTSQPIPIKGDQLCLQGGSVQLQTGDPLLIVKDGETLFAFVERVEPYLEAKYTLVTYKKSEPGISQTNGQENKKNKGDDKKTKVFVFRQRASLFGHNAPDWKYITFPNKANGNEWPDFKMKEPQIDLNTVYPKILKGSWVVLRCGDKIACCQVASVTTTGRSDFMLSSKVTRVEYPESEIKDVSKFELRGTEVFARSEELPQIEAPVKQVPVTAPIEKDEVVLEGVVPGLMQGRKLFFCGPRSGAPRNETACEVAVVQGTEDKEGHTVLTLTQGLQNSYERSAVAIYGNVVAADHGETVHEVLGSGDAAQANQRFTLKKSPLTYLPAATPTEGSTLEVRVNGVQWREVPSLYNEDARSQSYMVRLADDGTPSVIFGDGKHGARLPTGTENVSATYRCGIGSEGEVDPGSLTLLKTRPLGIREVTNPEPASGAATPDTRVQARVNGPLKVQTLGRIISVQDLESFARTFPGIAKAQAVSLWNGRTYVLHLTIAARDGQVVEPESELYKSLVSAIRAAGFLRQEIEVDSCKALSFQVRARVLVDQRYQGEAVKEAVRKKLLEAFSFEKREFGQSVFASEVIAVIQAVPGVVAVSLTKLYGNKDKQENSEKLDARKAKFDGEKIEPAQLLVLDPCQEFEIDPNDPNCIQLKVRKKKTDE